MLYVVATPIGNLGENFRDVHNGYRSFGKSRVDHIRSWLVLHARQDGGGVENDHSFSPHIARRSARNESTDSFF